jgi:hypothetical protein
LGSTFPTNEFVIPGAWHAGNRLIGKQVKWRLIGTYLVLSVGVAFALPPERWVNVLPDGNVQLDRDGPELDARHFRQSLLKMRKETPDVVFHLSVRSEEAFHRENNVIEQIQAAGFGIHAIKVD